MTTWAIGDVQGCYDELRSLLDRIGFDPAGDRLWFAGDLVNRGPKSLEVLRFVRDIGAVTVLGNHDLHLLASARLPQYRKRKDTLGRVLAAPDADELLDWLHRRPLLHHDPDSGYTLIHAGLPPQWDLDRARACAREVETVLRGPDYSHFFDDMYGDDPVQWSDDLDGNARLRYIVNCFTRLRYCDARGRLALQEKGPPGSQPPGFRPWFAWPQRRSRDMNILFGHWSTLGAYDGDGVHALDTGCLWGGKLTALRIEETPERVTLDCPGILTPGTQ